MKISSISENSEGDVSRIVKEYQLVSKEDYPVCFSLLPLQWPDEELPCVPKSPVYLRGSVDNGLHKIYKQVVAWKFSIEGTRPEVWVVSKDHVWCRLMKPRRAYEPIVRGILVTLQCLLYLKKNPRSSDKSLWDNVQGVFGHFEIKAAKSDLVNHLKLMNKMKERDENLSRSQLLCSYLKDFSQFCDTDKVEKSEFINDYDTDGSSEDDESDNEDDCFDTVCAFCDDGGELLCCEGKCLRSFHATRDAAGLDSGCKTLGYTRAHVDEMPSFFCPNCSLKKHQCFACGKLGDSDVLNAEVFRCISASCGHYYHPHCAAKLIFPKNKEQAADLEKKIASGEPFTCSAHKCAVCNQVENKHVEELQFAMCRRCPLSYHRKCLPREISLKDHPEEGIKQRAWDGLIPNRILIYCWAHEIDESLGTPSRDHIVFPDTAKEKVKHNLNSSHMKSVQKRKLKRSGERVDIKLLKTVNEDSVIVKARDKFHIDLGPADYCKSLPRNLRTSPKRHQKGELVQGRAIRPDDMETCFTEVNTNTNFESGDNISPSIPPLDKKSNKVETAKIEAKKRIMHLVENSSRLSFKSAPTNLIPFDKRITHGKVEGAIQALRAALRKLESGCSIEDAKAVCGPDVLKLVLRWKKKFRIYLAPFLHGARYTSFGRHFTHIHILEEIVERLHWYVHSNDMIVDFCCGSNDFSLLMKAKLEVKKKKCSFKNYDLLAPKNDFNFEKRDWMEVQPKELPPGRQLIMGLNPPFSHANKFVDQALKFKPKLLILIAPTTIKRIDQKQDKYDLIWEDKVIVSGKSFYFPGSIDDTGEHIDQWNVNAPSLTLWSRHDWTSIHKAIADEQKHIFDTLGSAQPNPMAASVDGLCVALPEMFETSSPIEEPIADTEDILPDMDISPPSDISYSRRRHSAEFYGENSFGHEDQPSSYPQYRRHYNEQRPLELDNEPVARGLCRHFSQENSYPEYYQESVPPNPGASRDNEARPNIWVRGADRRHNPLEMGVEPIPGFYDDFGLNGSRPYPRFEEHSRMEPVCRFPDSFVAGINGHDDQLRAFEEEGRLMTRCPDIYHDDLARSNALLMRRSMESTYVSMGIRTDPGHDRLEAGRGHNPRNDRVRQNQTQVKYSYGWLVE